MTEFLTIATVICACAGLSVIISAGIVIPIILFKIIKEGI